jgi:hypothetical protein
MLLCNHCGQCSYINDDSFICYEQISGTEVRYLSSDTGDVVDYGDTDTDSTGDSTTYCPHCEGDDINCAWEPEDEEDGKRHALGLRESYNLINQQRREKEAEIREESLAWDK